MDQDIIIEDFEEGLILTGSEASPEGGDEETSLATDEPRHGESSASQEALVHRINEAMGENMPLRLIQDIIEKAEVTNENFVKGFIPRLQWEIVFTALKGNRGDVLEMLLHKGISPDITCPEGTEHAGATALQIAADLENLELVKILLNHKANVMAGTALYTNEFAYSHIFRMFPPECRNALSIAFAKDNSALMKLLIAGYDRSYLPNGKSFLYLAFRARASECVTSLLKDPEIQTRFDQFEVPLAFGYLPGMNVTSMLYEAGLKQGVYTPDDLGLCLSEVTRNTQWKPCFCPCRPLRNSLRPDLVEIIDVLIELGANVNFESSSKNTTPLEGLLGIQYMEADSHIVYQATSTLLLHGATTRFEYMNKFFLDIFANILHGSCYDSDKVANYYLCMRSLLYSQKYSAQIKCWPIKGTITAFPVTKMASKTGLLLNTEFSLCQNVTETIRLTTLDLEIDFSTFHQSMPEPCLRNYAVQETLPGALEGFHTFLLYRMAVLPQSEYQSSASQVHQWVDSVTEPQLKSKTTYLGHCFPLIRSLKELSRVTILENLQFPKSIFAESLRLPSLLHKYVCLEYVS